MYDFKEKEFTHTIKGPRFSRFTRAYKTRGNKTPVSPISKFYTWVLGQIGEESGSKKFSIDVSSIWISEKMSDEFKKELTAWVKKVKPGFTKRYYEEAVGWMWLDLGPATFSRGLPEWAEEGRIYIHKNWKNPPCVYITDFNKYSINNQPATEKEFLALKKKHGDDLRVRDDRRCR